MSYVYVKSESQLYTVGFYDPNGKWQAESDHDSREMAAKRVHWLNGGSSRVRLDELEIAVNELQERVDQPDWRERR